MRIIVDHEICTGHGRCASVAPSVYTLDDSGFSAITELEVGPGDEAAARAGANNCPERAITIVD
jgi:ferredoxin